MDTSRAIAMLTRRLPIASSTKTPEDAVRDVLRAGTDIDCGNFNTSNAQSALDKNVITEKDLDDRLRMQFKVRMRLSHFDPIGR